MAITYTQGGLTNFNNGDWNFGIGKNGSLLTNGLDPVSAMDAANAFNVGSGTSKSTGFQIGDRGRSSSGLFDNFDLGGLAGVAQIIGSIGSIFQGIRNMNLAQDYLDLMSDQFNFQKGLANRNIANQAQSYNNAMLNSHNIAAGMIGGRDSSGNFGFTNPDIVSRYQTTAKSKYLDGSPIG